MASTDLADLVRDIKDGNLLDVRKAVEAGSSLSLSEYSAAGLTPLGAAVLYRKADVAQILLDAGADVQRGYKSELCQDKDARQSDWPEVSPPIHCAAASGQSDLICVLVNYGADVNDPSGLDYGAEVLPLFLAAGEATKTLIDLGGDVSRKNASGFTPLLHAIAREDVASARLLVEHGADVHVERTPKYKIRIDSPEGVSRELVVQGTSSPLIVAGHQGRLRPTTPQMIKILAQAGADVNKRYYIKDHPYDFTLLSLICGSRVPVPRLKGQFAKDDRYGEKELATVRALIDAGVDVHSPPVLAYICEGEMPFNDFESRFQILEALIQYGAKVTDVAPLAALLKSFKKGEEAKIQFRAMATVLETAGAKWKMLGNLDAAAVPEFLSSRGDRDGSV